MIFSQNLFRRPTPARLTRIEKILLQAHFLSVNYCQYNFVEHRTLISVPLPTYYSYLKFDKTSNILSFCSLKPIVILTPVGNGRVIHPTFKSAS
ncbi:Protein of uncharacterised function (DUF3125) [Staphylococcus aureus]|nr:hypothetical protein U79_00208 [Staphylococcus aureus M1216]EWP74641.1 hypothetical protein Q211_01349 [Staphylococcus aureus M1217]SQE63391.1 Protein of uncharacterised function (DUF3125) [Staphylococcus aureus]